MFNTDVRVGYPPCKGCTERHDLCHSTCNAYIEWKEKKLRVNRADREQNYKDGLMTSYYADRAERNRKKYE